VILSWISFLGTAASESDAPIEGAMVTFRMTPRAVRTPYIPHNMYKREWQTWMVGIECAEVLPAGTHLVSVSATAENATLQVPAPEVLAPALLPIDATRVRVVVQAGDVAMTYAVEAQIACDDAPQSILTERFTMTIVPDTPCRG
jgi:hypothetical protein